MTSISHSFPAVSSVSPPFLSSLLSLPFLCLLFQPSALSCFCFLHFAFSLFLSVLFGFPPSSIPVLPNFSLICWSFSPHFVSFHSIHLSWRSSLCIFSLQQFIRSYSKLLFHPQPYLTSRFNLILLSLLLFILFHPAFSITCSSCVCFSSVHHFFILHFLPFMPLCLCSSFLFMLHFLFSSCPLPALSLKLPLSNLFFPCVFLFFAFSLLLIPSSVPLLSVSLYPLPSLAPLQMEVNFTRSRKNRRGMRRRRKKNQCQQKI